MQLKVVHLSITPLAGGPYRLVSVLRRQTGWDVRLIDLKRWGAYPQDVIYEESRDEAMALVNGADVIHLHNYFDLRENPFAPIDLEGLWRAGKRVVRQFRTSPGTLARKTGYGEEMIVSGEVPSIVIAQFHERYYPNALVVPNAVPSELPEYRYQGERIEYDICYSPSGMAPAWSSRWDTKGAPETIFMLRDIARRARSRNLIISGKPLSEVLEKKRRSRIIIDDLVTGSYHASGLEGLCLGKAVLCHLDQRLEVVLKEVCGTEALPFVNARLEDAGEVLLGLLAEDDLVREMGEANRRWIEAYWSERVIAERYRRVYEDLLTDPRRVRRQESLRVDGPVRSYFAIELPDALYRGRVARGRAGLPVMVKVGIAWRSGKVRVKRNLSACVPGGVLKWCRARRPGARIENERAEREMKP